MPLSPHFIIALLAVLCTLIGTTETSVLIADIFRLQFDEYIDAIETFIIC